MSILSEAYGDHPLHLHRIIPIDFASVRTLPESHVWPESGDSEVDALLTIPVIDVADPDASNLIGRACETWGVFELTNHGIPLELLDKVESEAGRLFALPAQQKLKALRTAGSATGYGVARISPFFNKDMWHEGFTIIGSPVDHARELWPLDHQRFCDVMEDYEKRMKELAATLIRLVLKYLETSDQEENMDWINHTPGRATTALQLNSYPLCPDPDRAMGLAPHTDTSLITILHQSSTSSALQIFKEGVGWGLVPPTPGALVVNVGDLLHIASNARFPTVLHRVVMREARLHRLSVAFFYSPPTDCCLSPLTAAGECARYRAVSVAEFMGMKAKNLEKAFSLIRV